MRKLGEIPTTEKWRHHQNKKNRLKNTNRFTETRNELNDDNELTDVFEKMTLGKSDHSKRIKKSDGLSSRLQDLGNEKKNGYWFT